MSLIPHPNLELSPVFCVHRWRREEVVRQP